MWEEKCATRMMFFGGDWVAVSICYFVEKCRYWIINGLIKDTKSG